MSDLLPCPFCGVRLAQSKGLSTKNAEAFVHPFVAECPITATSVIYSNQPVQIERWNTRAQPALGEREIKAQLFDAIMANVPDAYEKDGSRILTGEPGSKRLVRHLEAQDAVHVITVARDRYRALTAALTTSTKGDAG